MSSNITATHRRQLLLRGVGSILLASIFFGMMAVCVRIASREMASPQITFIRFLGSFLLLLLANGPRSLRPEQASISRLLLRGTLGSVSILLYFTAIQWAGAGLATLLHCTYPISTAAIAVFLLGERFSGRLASALLLNAIGIVIVVGPGAQVPPGALFGAMCALAASMFAGGALTTARLLRTRESALLITTYFMATGTLLSAPALLLGMPPMTVSLGVSLAGVIVTSVTGQFLIHHGLGFTTATLGSLTAATSIVSAALFEALLLGDYPPATTLAGACVLVAAVGLAVSAGGGQVPPDPE